MKIRIHMPVIQAYVSLRIHRIIGENIGKQVKNDQ